ncbi:hypothetical protein BCR41DRAFT_423052 [Lobosporangium transversale]|uniref:Uncharacterized protein n=1 Tax=Lobosporangium transversale TaxID=64571 RepID=A0A1Y2GLE8_9FUNG|nr:hypothetical protein BCR41DRAFT_423052 [Lobosporangium transversale]ORZ12983.1 hypothetical protein BCR41DRAFT_423052 [Lobosporangium transversale]|eukprot:XP_021880332.1 hypothetical protein BCR41DRAFT_423052 [Lobosporangium transversale]
MAYIDTLGEHSQAFRAYSSEEFSPSSQENIQLIPTRLDPISNQRVIFWSDILDQFPNAECCVVNRVNGDRAVLFLTDSEFEYLIPKRIPYYPGQVLDIISSEDASNLSHSPIISNKASFNQSIQGAPDVEKVSTAVHLSQNNDVTSLVKFDSQQQQLQGSDIQAIMSGQMQHAEDLMRSVRYYYDRLQFEVQKSRELQERVYAKQKDAKELLIKGEEEGRKWQQLIYDQQVHMQKSFEEKQAKILRMQEEALERLAVIQNRVQAVLTQTYELHEYPIPHLFIVLPKASRRRDTITNPFSNQFRLFFLCECGKHTMTERSKISHEIHLAKHEGYDIERPTEFFQKYGPYVLTMMEMIKFGFSVAGMLVPALANTGLVEGMDVVQKNLDLTNSSIGSLVDDTINFINDQYTNADGGMDLEDGDGGQSLDKLEALEGADLRQLESFLSVHDEGRVLGNLYRIVTTEGKVKWVCIDHYRENYRTSAMQLVRDSISSNQGLYKEDKGEIIIAIGDRDRANEFYDVLTKARGIQYLDITLAWDATLDDLRQLAAAVSNANILHLTLSGNKLIGPNRDFFNRGRRFDPIVQLLQNRRIQSLKLTGFKDFYAHVSSAPLAMAPQVRNLALSCEIDPMDKESTAIVTRILKTVPALAKLTLWSTQFIPTFDFLMTQLQYVPTLDSLKVLQDDFDVTFKLFQSKIRGTTMRTIRSFSAIVAREREFLKRGLVTKFVTRELTDKLDEQSWLDAMVLSPNLSEVHLSCHGGRSLELIEAISSTRDKTISQTGTCSLARLELQMDNVSFVVIDFSMDKPEINDTEYKDGATTVSTTAYTMTDLNTAKFPKADKSNPLTHVLRLHGHTIERLAADGEFTDDHVAILDQVTQERGSRLLKMNLEPDSLTTAACESLDRVLERSHSLKRFILQKYSMNNKEQHEMIQTLLTRHGKRINELVLVGSSAEEWLPIVANTVPTRRELPVLDTLNIKSNEKVEVSQEIADWLVAMATAPPSVTPPPPPPTSSDAIYTLDTTVEAVEALDPISRSLVQRSIKRTVPISDPSKAMASKAWTSLEVFWLTGLHMQSQQWEALIKAIDFTSAQDLGFWYSNFDLDHLQTLVDTIPEAKKHPAPLRFLRLGKTKFDGHGSRPIEIPREYTKALKKKAPLAKIQS